MCSPDPVSKDLSISAVKKLFRKENKSLEKTDFKYQNLIQCIITDNFLTWWSLRNVARGSFTVNQGDPKLGICRWPLTLKVGITLVKWVTNASVIQELHSSDNKDKNWPRHMKGFRLSPHYTNWQFPHFGVISCFVGQICSILDLRLGPE